jgi:phosphatidylserine decarboxylase
MKKQLFILSQYLLPQHLFSRWMGKLISIRTPWFKNWAIRRFIRRYNVDMSSALVPDINAYVDFNAFFTRALVPSARPVDPDPSHIISPADGSFSQCGEFMDGRAITAKGFHFTVLELFGGVIEAAHLFQGGQLATIYLSPKDYHRVHMPLAGRLKKTIYIPGELFSVNQATTESVPRLFARNERLVCLFETAIGPMAVVLVGAFFVASIYTTWSGLVTPRKKREIDVLDYSTQPIYLEKGAELGHFELGSTVIMLLPKNSIAWLDKVALYAPVNMGEGIARILKTDILL